MIKKYKKYNNTKKLSYKKNNKSNKNKSNKKNKTLKKRKQKKHRGGSIRNSRGGSICKLLTNSSSSGSSVITPTFLNTYNEPTKLFYTGITNVGNTCYMNASLQLLWSIPEIRKDIVNLHQTQLYQSYTDYRYKIIIILAAMFNTFYSKTSEDNNYYGKNDTETIKDKLKKLSLTSLRTNGDTFDPKQEDAHDYLIELLEYLCNSEDSAKNTCRFIDLKKHLNIRFNETTECTYSPKKKRVPRDPYLNWCIPLTIDVDVSNDIDIETLLTISLYNDIEKLTDCLPEKSTIVELNEKYEGPGTKSIKYEPNNNLLIQLLRFTYSDNFINKAGNKIRTKITPNKKIEIDSIKFKLQGCIIHYGGTKGGHYKYLVFDDNGEPLKIINDSNIETHNTTDHLENGYIYYYRRETPIKE